MATHFWDKRIPKLFGFMLLIVGVAATASLVLTGATPFLKAAPSENPENIRITNVTDTSFTVTYTTQASVIGTLSYGKDSLLGQVALDDRDQASGNPAAHMLHSISVRSLQPDTTYYFAILSGQTTYLNNNKQFTITTGKAITTPPSSEEPLSGIIVMPDGSKPQEALVYVTTDGGQMLSTLAKTTGLYIIPLNTLRNTDSSAAFTLKPNTKLQVLVLANDNSSSKAVLLASQRNPVPTITLSDNYDYTFTNEPLASTSALPIGFPQFALDTTIVATPKIDTPKDNQSFNDSQPLLQGKALPNSTVEIAIHSSDAITAQVISDNSGNWSYRPDKPLSPGEHTITITSKNSLGIMETITKTFTILTDGTQFAYAYSPTPTPTVTVTTAPTPTPSKSPTPTPTKITTPSPTTVVTATPTVTTVATPSPTTAHFVISPTSSSGKKIPATGSETLVPITLTGLVTFAAGIILFLVTKGAL